MTNEQRLKKLLADNGWTVARTHTRGTHIIYYCPCGQHTASISQGNHGGKDSGKGKGPIEQRVRQCARERSIAA